MRFAETGGEVVVTVSPVLTVEGTGGGGGGGLLTKPASPAPRTAAGEGLDTDSSMATGRMTDRLLTAGPSVAGLAAADRRSDTGPSQTTARTTLGDLTLGSSPASLGRE